MALKASTRTRLATASVLVLVLAAGMVLGIAVDRQLEARGASSEGARWSRPPGGGDRGVRGAGDRSPDSSRSPSRGPSQRGSSLLVEQVGLSEVQLAQVDSIMRFYGGQMRALHEEFDDAYNTRYREIQTASREAVRGVLTAEQVTVYDSIRAEWQRRREERRDDSTGSARAPTGLSRARPPHSITERVLSEIIIRTESLKKYYVLGAETVRAVRGVDMEIRTGRVRGHHGPVREREVHLHEPPRVPGHADGG